MKIRSRFLSLVTTLFLVTASFAQSAVAATYVSVEPIPSGDVVGNSNLVKILSLGYSRLAVWSERLSNDCRMVDKVIGALSSSNAIQTVNPGNTRFAIAAGGFEAVTNPTFVFSIEDSGTGSASAADVNVLDNALGYVFNQGGTIHFNPADPGAYDFPLDYAVVQFSGDLTGLDAKTFFDYLGTINPALWSGQFAGFTQLGNAMLFLQPATNKREFIEGLSTAAASVPGAIYLPLTNGGHPTTARAGVAFPGNDWIQFPGGNQYLANLGTSSPALLSALAKLRSQHLQAVNDLVRAIDRGNVDQYLSVQFKCPR